jgi:hypothetical protein
MFRIFFTTLLPQSEPENFCAMPNKIMTPSLTPPFFIRKIFIRVFLALSLLMAGSSAYAQLIDRIEIGRKGNIAEIYIRFAVQIQYLSHSPLEEGKLLRVFIRLTQTNSPEGESGQQTLRSPDTDLVPRFSVTYPDLNDEILISFSQATHFDVKPGTDSRSIIITVPILPGAKDFLVEQRVDNPKPKAETHTTILPAPPQPAPTVKSPALPVEKKEASTATAQSMEPATLSSETAAVPPPPVLSTAEIEKIAKKFMDEAHQALASKDGSTAVNRLYRALGLPSNSQTQAAQALIGEARELTGEYAKARAEYDLYLKLYPKGAEAPHVKERLVSLPKDAPRREQTAAAKKASKDAKPAEWVTTASISQYHYLGNSHIETITPPPPGQLVFNVDTLSLQDQNSLISTFDINARKRDAFSDTRIVVRDTDNRNFLPGKTGYNRLYAAYAEHTDKEIGYFVRAGRQNPSGGGVMERFDGLSLGYNLDTTWRINAAGGSAVEFLSPFKKNFYSVSLDLLAQPNQWGFSTYFVDQTLDGALNRRAIGGEARYFDSQITIYSMLDYDLAFNGLNIALLQGNYLAQDGSNYYAILDHRKSPSYGLTNAMSASPGQSISDMIATLGIDEVRNQAKVLTAVSDLFSAGLTYPISPQWQLGADYRLAAISGTEAVGAMPAQPGSGNSHVFSVRAIGNNLFFANAIGVADASYILAPTYKGSSLGLSYVFLFQEVWRLDGNLHYYTQKDDTGETQNRWTPTIKLSYRWKDSVSLEAEIGKEIAKMDGPLRVENSSRNYMYFGYRWDLR